jgi:hypothetical protein
MPGFSGELLALAIDPYTPSRFSGMKPTRRIRFESPARGKPSTWVRDRMVIGFVRQQLASAPKLEAAINAVSARFKISRRTVQDIWKTYKQRLGIK